MVLASTRVDHANSREGIKLHCLRAPSWELWEFWSVDSSRKWFSKRVIWRHIWLLPLGRQQANGYQGCCLNILQPCTGQPRAKKNYKMSVVLRVMQYPLHSAVKLKSGGVEDNKRWTTGWLLVALLVFKVTSSHILAQMMKRPIGATIHGSLSVRRLNALCILLLL